MDWMAARSYYIGYSSIDRLDSIIFFHNYLYTWSIGLIFSLIPPILYLFAPSSLQTNRSSYLLIICLVCLSNMCCLYIHPYMLSGSGEPNLPFHTCRFIVYISTLAKPIGLYLTLLFSIERIFTKILSKSIFRTNHHRLLFKRFFLLFIFLGISFILMIRLFEVLKLLNKNPATNDKNIISRQDMMKANNYSSDSILTFQYCYRSMTIDIYAKILSFYIIQYWFEYVILGMIILILVCLIMNQYVLPRFQQRSSSRLSVNTKFYFILSSSVILFELVLRLLHLIVDDVDYNNTQTQVNYLQTMLFVYNFRCIVLPFIICLTTCDPLKQWFNELFILRSYLDNFDENDHTNTMIDRSDLLSSSSSSSPQQTFAKNHTNEHFDL